MSYNPSEELAPSARMPLAVLNIGVWTDDTFRGCVRGDAVMARLFGFAEAEFANGVSWDRFTAVFHPEDLIHDTAARRRIREEGGLFAWEHRIVPAPGLMRWVLARGHFERDADGHVRGRGIVIDITDCRTDGHVDGPARFMTTAVGSMSPLDQIADRAVGLWEMIRELPPVDADRLRHLLRPLLYEIGRQIAATIAGEAGQRPGRTRH